MCVCGVGGGRGGSEAKRGRGGAVKAHAVWFGPMSQGCTTTYLPHSLTHSAC